MIYKKALVVTVVESFLCFKKIRAGFNPQINCPIKKKLRINREGTLERQPRYFRNLFDY